MTLFGLVLYALFFGFLTAFFAERKNYNSHTWFWLGIILGLVATLIILLQPPKESEEQDVSDIVQE